jgi:hypothetical protein
LVALRGERGAARRRQRGVRAFPELAHLLPPLLRLRGVRHAHVRVRDLEPARLAEALHDAELFQDAHDSFVAAKANDGVEIANHGVHGVAHRRQTHVLLELVVVDELLQEISFLRLEHQFISFFQRGQSRGRNPRTKRRASRGGYGGPSARRLELSVGGERREGNRFSLRVAV